MKCSWLALIILTCGLCLAAAQIQQIQSDPRGPVVNAGMSVRESSDGVHFTRRAEPVFYPAADGQQAIELAHRHRPAVVVMDFSMPGMNGVEATRRITAELPDVQIIGLSMYMETAQAEAMLNAGAKAYLSKGAPTEDLIAEIQRIGWTSRASGE